MNCENTDSASHKPRNIDDKEKYKLLGIATDCQRALIMTIITRNRKGLWTMYEHCDNCKSPEKRMSEIIEELGLKINFRKATCGGGKVEFCL